MFESEMGRPGIHRGRRRPIVARERHHGARHINVPRDSSTIQEAIQGANQGDTIHVEPQTYTEQITIDKDITLIGAGANSTIIQSPKVLSPDNFGKKFIVEIRQGANVIMSGFTIRGPDGSPHWGIGVLDGSTLELSHATVTRIRQSPALSGGTGVLVGLPPWVAEEQVGNAIISHVVVSEYSNHGICIIGNGSTANISETQVIGYGPTPELGQVGIMVGFGARATVRQNQNISQNICTQDGFGPDPLNQGQSVGIFTIEADAETVISNNKVEDNDVGIYQYSSNGCHQTDNNILQNNGYFGLVIQDGDNTCSRNSISDGNVGIGVVAGSVNTVGTLQDNRIRDTLIMDVQEISAEGFTATANTS